MNKLKVIYRLISIYILIILLIPSVILTADCRSVNVAVTQLKETVTPPFTLTCLHVNDTHSYVIPHNILLTINGKRTLTNVGGWSLLMTAVEDIRSHEQNVLLLHAGGILDGTIWSARYGGRVDADAMNTLQLDAFTPGECDFTASPSETGALFQRMRFPVLAANLDTGAATYLAGSIRPYTIVERDGQKIGIIGLVNPDIELNPQFKDLSFISPEKTAGNYIGVLNNQGINKIIVLSSLGYRADVELAKTVAGIDLIVGSYSHTLMGGPEFEQIGLKPDLPYPTELKSPSGDPVLIVHAWENNQMLGQIKLDFDDKGRIINYTGRPFIYAMSDFKLADPDWGWIHLCPCRPDFGQIIETITQNPGIKIYWDNAEMSGTLQPYIQEISTELNTVVATAEEDLLHSPGKGPGPVIADAILRSARRIMPQTQIVLYRCSDVHGDFFSGEILINDVYMILPQQQPLAVMTVKGNQLKSLLEMALDNDAINKLTPPPYELSGLIATVDMTGPSGNRIRKLQVITDNSTYAELKMNADYTIAGTAKELSRVIDLIIKNAGWPSFMDGLVKPWYLDNLKFGRLETTDTGALIDYLRSLKKIKNAAEERTILSTPVK
jgi:5'-nucleotidase